jgi:hypothetical protein
MTSRDFDGFSRRIAVLGLSASALISVAKMGSADAKGKKKGGKCRCRARQVCRCPRCPIDLPASGV